MSRLPCSRWFRRRVYLPLVSVFLLGICLAVALIRSDTSQIILYNETGAALGPITLGACGQSARFERIEDETSVRLRLKGQGRAGSVVVSGPDLEGGAWEGAYLEATGGYVVTMHIRSGMEVEAHTQVSIWQQLVFGRGNGGQ